MDVKIEPSWSKILNNEFEKPYFVKLTEFVKTEYRTQQIFPPGKRNFQCVRFMSLSTRLKL